MYECKGKTDEHGCHWQRLGREIELAHIQRRK